MNYFQTFAISSAGMDIERARLDVAALNLANVNTATAPGTVGYRPLKVVAKASSLYGASFKNTFDVEVANFPKASIETMTNPVKLVFEPDHPMADKKGFVSYPAIDNATEMMTIMSAMRAYEANVAVMTAARTMAVKALDIGGQS